MKLAGRYSNAGDLRLEGDADGLLELAEALEGARGAFFEFGLKSAEPDPAPYDAFLNRLRFKIQSGRPVCVTRVGDVLHVKGSAEHMRILAGALRGCAGKAAPGRGAHLTVEPGPDWCDERTMTLVISLRA